MHIAPQLLVLYAVTTAAGLLMVLSGVGKKLLVWKLRRTCPACGREVRNGRCGCLA
jgi:hypothetical protein